MALAYHYPMKFDGSLGTVRTCKETNSQCSSYEMAVRYALLSGPHQGIWIRGPRPPSK